MNQLPPPVPDDSGPRAAEDLPFGSSLPSEPPPPLQAEAPFGAAFDPQFASPPPAPGWVPPTVPGRIQVQEAGASPTLVLILGITSLVTTASGCLCGFTVIVGLPLGIVAWFWGSSEIKKVEAGLLPPSAKSQLEAGRICGLIGAILSLLGTVLLVVYMVFVFSTIASGNGP
jgi:hypothetical protein